MDSIGVNDERLETIPEIINESNTNNYNITETEKKYFEEDNNFIDYFVEVGVNPEIFKNKYLYESKSLNDINTNIIPQIITKFPKIDKKYLVIESTLIQQIFPHGFNAVEVSEKPDPEFYSIILDNQLYSAIYTHKYFACLLIYESIKDYAKLNEKYKSIDILSSIMGSKANKEEKEKENQKNQEKKLPSAFIKAERLSQQECQELIFDLFKEDKDKFPSYYQIKSFIDVFAEQLKTFSKNYILSIDYLREFRSIDLTKIRIYIIEGFINVTKYFTRSKRKFP